MKVKLGDVCEMLNGFAFRSEGYVDDGFRIIRISNVQKGYIEDSSPVFYPLDSVEAKKYALEENDLLISLTGNVGRVGILPRELLPATLNQRVACIKIKNESQLAKPYLFNFLNSDYFEAKCIDSSKGVAQKNMSTEWLKEYEIPLPPLDEQRRIAAVLDKVSDLIAKRRAQLDKLDELVKARFVEMFGDPVLNPMKWPEQSLENMADIVSGITKGRKARETELIEVPYMAVSNVKDGYIDWTNVKTILATKSEIEQYRLLPDDVLMTEGGDPDKLGRGAIIQKPLENCIHQNHIFRVRLNESAILPIYFAEFLQHQKAKQYFLRCAKQTTGIASINMSQLKSLPTLVPPVTIQQSFAEIVRRINKSELTIQQSLDKLEMLKKALMQEYFGRGVNFWVY
jgi:hypothetical protein